MADIFSVHNSSLYPEYTYIQDTFTSYVLQKKKKDTGNE